MSGGRAQGDPRIMVVGIGNRDRGDDGAGPAALDRLAERAPAGVTLALCRDDLLALVDDWADIDGLICVDAAAPMGAPGRIHRLDLATDTLPHELSVPASSHAFGLPDAIALARALGTAPARIVVFAVEGQAFDGGAGLSPEVDRAIPELADRVLAEIARLRPLLAERAHA
jgi:hydrogenase maturation protease